MSLRVVQIGLDEANAYVGRHHRHSNPTLSHKFSIGAIGDNEIVEELDPDGIARISLQMDPPPGQYSKEIWSWTGRLKASASERTQRGPA